MSHPCADILLVLSDAPDSQLDTTIAAKLKSLAEAPNVSSDDIKAILDSCAHGALASGFAMNVLDGLWRRLRAAEGLPDPDAEGLPDPDAEATRRAKALREAALRTRPEDVKAALYGPIADRGEEQKRLVALLRAIDALLRTGRFLEFDGVLERLRVDALAPTLAIGILRYSFAARGRLPSWTAARERVRDALAARGEDAAALRGL